MTRIAALRSLTTLLRGEAPATAVDWPAVLRLANAHLLVPALFSALRRDRRLTLAPGEVVDYLALLYRLNGERNAALRVQAEELIVALNAVDVAPLMLKGGLVLFDDLYGDPAARMIGDLDILVPVEAQSRVLPALRGLGYAETAIYGPDHNAYGELARPTDPAALDLHRAPIDAPHLLDAAALWRAAVPLAAGLGVLAPAPTHRVLHALLHAQIHHLGGYYRGELKLNQLYEVATLALSFADAVDWPAIATPYAAHRLLPALQSYLLAAERLFGLPWPLEGAAGAAARLSHARATAQLLWPALGYLGGPWGNLRGAFAWHRMHARYASLPGHLPWRLRHLGQFLARQPLRLGLARMFRMQ